MKKFIILLPILIITLLFPLSSQAAPIAEFKCDLPVDGTVQESLRATLGKRCGVQGANNLPIICAKSGRGVEFACSSNRSNPCFTNVCLVRIGDFCEANHECEGGATCNGSVCEIDGGDDLGGIVGVTTTDIRDPVRRLINIGLGFLGALTVIMIIYGGSLWLTAAGNEEKVDKGRQVLAWAAIGAIVISIAWTISSYILQLGKDLG